MSEVGYRLTTMDVIEKSGLSRGSITNLVKHGILNPAREASRHQNFYSKEQLARACVAAGLIGEGWSYDVIRDELSRPGYLAENKQYIPEELRSQLGL